jgi:hypothetical protein
MHGASSTEKRSYHPNHLLQWEVMRWTRRGITYYDMVGVPKLEDRRGPLLRCLQVQDRLRRGGNGLPRVPGFADLEHRAEAWYRFEPAYYRLYYKLKGNVFY